MTQTEINPDAVAAKFDATLREWLSDGDYAEMLRLNRTSEYRESCASHNYCDANMAMADALASFGIDADRIGTDGAVDALWSAAWNAWKASKANGGTTWFAVYDTPDDSDYVGYATKAEAVAEAAKYLAFASGSNDRVYVVAVADAVQIDPPGDLWSLWDHLHTIPNADYVWIHRGAAT